MLTSKGVLFTLVSGRVEARSVNRIGSRLHGKDVHLGVHKEATRSFIPVSKPYSSSVGQHRRTSSTGELHQINLDRV
jgi:hypothetical protein